MMRYYDPEDKDDVKEAERLKVEPWMLDVITRNPEYTSWGPHEDAMGAKDASFTVECWEDFEIKKPNALNEIINFYFEVWRPSRDCDRCGGTGYAPYARLLESTFYDGDHWADKLDRSDVEALVAEGRLCNWDGKKWVAPTVDVKFIAEVNLANRRAGMGPYNHDAINRHLLVQHRAKQAGKEVYCPGCEGHAEQFTAPHPHLALVLWVIHPRRGNAFGYRVERIKKSELPEVYAMLKLAADRNAERFAKVVQVAAALER